MDSAGCCTHRPARPKSHPASQAEGPARYALHMKRLRAFLERLPGGHRPPTGPLTTSEATEAEELRQETLAKDAERIEREQSREPDSSSG